MRMAISLNSDAKSQNLGRLIQTTRRLGGTTSFSTQTSALIQQSLGLNRIGKVVQLTQASTQRAQGRPELIGQLISTLS